MVTAADVRRIALALPRTEEHLIRDRIKFRIGRIVYLAISPDETTMGFAVPKEERAGLIAAEPEKFLPPVPADERYNWCRVRLAALDRTELAELVFDAWTMAVPKRVVAAHLATMAPTGSDTASSIAAGQRARPRDRRELTEDARPAVAPATQHPFSDGAADRPLTAGGPPAGPGLSDTPRTRLRRGKEKARTARSDLFDVLDACFVCHLGVVVDGTPMVVPTVY